MGSLGTPAILAKSCSNSEGEFMFKALLIYYILDSITLATVE